MTKLYLYSLVSGLKWRDKFCSKPEAGAPKPATSSGVFGPMEAWPVSLGALLLCVNLLVVAVSRGASGEQINDSRSLSAPADHSSQAETINIQSEDTVKFVPTSGGHASSLFLGKSGQAATTGQHARLPRRLKSSNLPELSPMSNASAVAGRDVRLVCIVEHLGQYQVAWLKEETRTILSIDTNIIITNYRIFLIPDMEERKWVLHIKDVQESDRGFYQCQVNTNPMRSTRGYLEVNVPPTIIEYQSSQLAEVLEHGDVKIQCKAKGHPNPIVTWRRDDGSPIRLYGKFSSPTSENSNFDYNQQQTVEQDATNLPGSSLIVSELTNIRSDRLSLFDVDRQMAGNYVCTASNGIPPQSIKKIPLYVKFPAKVSLDSSIVVVGLGEQVEIDCTIEAYPMANSSWIRSAHPYTHRFNSHEDWSHNMEDSIHKSSRSPSSSSDIDWKYQQNYRRLIRHLPRFKSEVRFTGSISNSTDVVKDIRGYFTVQRIAIGPNSYKIRMIINKVQASDFGQYICTATNPLGDAQAQLTLTRKEETDEKNLDKNFQQDALANFQKNTKTYTPFRSKVFDENYLKSIQQHQHQKNKATSNRWDSKYSEKSSATGKPELSVIPVLTLVVITQLWITHSIRIRAS